MAESSELGEQLAHYYDLDLGQDQPDLDLYLALAASNPGPVLELAAGSGRIAIPLALAGHAVTAVDRDRHMLERAQKAWLGQDDARRRGSLRTVEADITQLNLPDRFGLVILALNTLLMLPGREAQIAALRTMASHLSSEGRAVLDVWLPAPEDLALYDGRVMLEWIRHDVETGEMVAKLSAARYEPAGGTASVQTFFDIWQQRDGALRRLSRQDDLSFVGSTELLDLVQRAGLLPVVVAGDYSMGPFGTGSERLVLVCGLL
jgi:SAM-dependent methyltransferase